MTEGNSANADGPITLTAKEREALCAQLREAELIWSQGSLWEFTDAESGAQRLMGDFGRKPFEGIVELTIPLDDLRQMFSKIKGDLVKINNPEAWQAAIVAGVCERVLGVGEQAQ